MSISQIIAPLSDPSEVIRHRVGLVEDQEPVLFGIDNRIQLKPGEYVAIHYPPILAPVPAMDLKYVQAPQRCFLWTSEAPARRHAIGQLLCGPPHRHNEHCLVTQIRASLLQLATQL